jgi:septal ring-binding cell division protein DamX
VVLVAFIYLLWQPDDVVDDSGREPVDSPLTTDRGAPARGDPPPAAGRLAPMDESPSATPTTAREDGESDAAGDSAEAAPGEVPLPAPSIAAPPALERPGVDVEQPTLAAEEPAPQQSPAVSDPTAPEPTPAPPDEPKRAPASREPPVAQEKATARPEVPVVDIGPPVARYRDAEWIMRQPPAAYTLQLASFSTAARADEYLEEQAIPESFARFRQQRDGRTLHVVVYGSFDSEAAAEEAVDNLPPGAGNVKPWIRTFERVQEAVRTAQQP